MKTNFHCWLKIALQRLQCIFIILWIFSNKRRTAAANLVLRAIPLALGKGPGKEVEQLRRLFDGGAY